MLVCWRQHFRSIPPWKINPLSTARKYTRGVYLTFLICTFWIINWRGEVRKRGVRLVVFCFFSFCDISAFTGRKNNKKRADNARLMWIITSFERIFETRDSKPNWPTKKSLLIRDLIRRFFVVYKSKMEFLRAVGAFVEQLVIRGRLEMHPSKGSAPRSFLHLIVNLNYLPISLVPFKIVN